MRYPLCSHEYHLLAGWYWGRNVPIDCLLRSADRHRGYCLGLTPSQARYLLSQRVTHSASLLGDRSSASTWREPVARLKMLSASSGRDQSKKSLATTVATARPKQEAGARRGEHDTLWGILRPIGPRWSRNKNFRGSSDVTRETGGTQGGEGRGRGGRAPTGPPTRPLEAEGRGGPARGRGRERQPAARAPSGG